MVRGEPEGGDAVVASKEDVALELAKSHALEPGIRAVYCLIGPRETDQVERIKLLEVNEDTIERGIEPLSFGPDPSSGILFPVVVVDVSPREFEAIREGMLPLPHEWKLGSKLSGE